MILITHLQCSMGFQASWIIGGLIFHCTSSELWDKETNKTPVIVTVLNCDMANCSPRSVAWRLGEESVTTWRAIGHTVISTWNLEMLKLSRRQSGQSNILQVVKTLGMMSWEDNNPLYWAGQLATNYWFVCVIVNKMFHYLVTIGGIHVRVYFNELTTLKTKGILCGFLSLRLTVNATLKGFLINMQYVLKSWS